MNSFALMWILLFFRLLTIESSWLHSGHRSDRDHFARDHTSLMSVRCSLVSYWLFSSAYRKVSIRTTGSSLDTCFRKKQAHFKQKVTHILSILSLRRGKMVHKTQTKLRSGCYIHKDQFGQGARLSCKTITDLHLHYFNRFCVCSQMISFDFIYSTNINP